MLHQESDFEQTKCLHHYVTFKFWNNRVRIRLHWVRYSIEWIDKKIVVRRRLLSQPDWEYSRKENTRYQCAISYQYNICSPGKKLINHMRNWRISLTEPFEPAENFTVWKRRSGFLNIQFFGSFSCMRRPCGRLYLNFKRAVGVRFPRLMESRLDLKHLEVLKTDWVQRLFTFNRIICGSSSSSFALPSSSVHEPPTILRTKTHIANQCRENDILKV